MSDAKLTGNFTVIDTETTGLSPRTCEIIEVGAVRFRDFEPVAEYGTLVRPHSYIPSNISSLTGITNQMVKDCPYFEDIADDFMSFIGNDDVVGHNLTFDLNFLSSGGMPIFTSGNEFIDTLKLSRRLLQKGVDIENHRLSTVCDFFGIDLTNAHRAVDDAMAAGILFKKLINYEKRYC